MFVTEVSCWRPIQGETAKLMGMLTNKISEPSNSMNYFFELRLQLLSYDSTVGLFKNLEYIFICNATRFESFEKFAERSSISKYDKRKKTDLQIPRLNIDFSSKSFNYTGRETWNSIPTHIKESDILNRFKNGLFSKPV